MWGTLSSIAVTVGWTLWAITSKLPLPLVALGVGMALLVWMYLISLVVLVGAEFNALLFPRAMLGKELTAINSSKS